MKNPFRVPVYSLMLVLFLLPFICGAEEVFIEVDPEKAGSVIDPLVFGSFSEEHWGDIVPGVFEQYTVNPSFEEWPENTKQKKTSLVFKTKKYPGVAFPWEPAKKGKYSLSEDCSNTKLSQALEVSGSTAAVSQRLALPDYRTKEYVLKFFSKKDQDVSLKVVMYAGKEKAYQADVVTQNGAWSGSKLSVSLSAASVEKHLSRYGVYRLAFEVSGNGKALVDNVTIIPADAIEGKFNPETVENFKKFGIKMVRWPGGNFTSGYHFMDGLGETDKRPTLPNPAWSGVTTNLCGTDDFLRFCELTEAAPLMGVGFGEISAEEAADWVEYCNGSESTKMGSLRANNGHKAPYNVKYWGVGNEVFGNWQIGHTDAVTYAKGLVKMSRAMKQKDPSIIIIGCAENITNNYKSEGVWDWNRKLLEIAGQDVDALDVHFYLEGVKNSFKKESTRNLLLRAMLGAEKRLGEYCEDLRKLIKEKAPGRDIKLALLEWAVVGSGDYQTNIRSYGNALCTAIQYNEILRRSDFITMTAFHNFTFYINPVPVHAGPPAPRTHVSRIYSEMAGGYPLQTNVKCPEYDAEDLIKNFSSRKTIPEVDALAVRAKDGSLNLFLVNRDLKNGYRIRLLVKGKTAGKESELVCFNSEELYVPEMFENAGKLLIAGSAEVRLQENMYTFDVPKHSISKFKLR